MQNGIWVGMMNYQIEIQGVPEGWKPVAFRRVEKGDNYWDEVEGIVRLASSTMEYNYMVVEKIRWRQQHGEMYYSIQMSPHAAEVTSSIEQSTTWHDHNWEAGNYFETAEEAQAKVDQINELLQRI